MQQNIILPNPISYNGEICNTVGAIKMNDGAFLIAQNNKTLVNVDFTKLASLIQNINFEIKNPTQTEVAFMDFIQEKIQEKLYNGETQINEVPKVVSNINRYINTTPNLLQTLKNTNLDNNKEMQQQLFEELLKDNEYFKKEKIENINQNISFPQYDEGAVTAILLQQPNLDMDTFINQYFNDFTLDQINILLEKYNLDEIKNQKLLQRKKELDVITSESVSNSKSSLDKRKNLSLPGFKENKEAAFIDTLLLSFTVGTICGIYLMYFILTIMS